MKFGLALAGLATATALLGAQSESGVRRRIYVTATNSAGTHVDTLTAADLTVKEGGKDRTIVRLEPSTERLKICLAIDEGFSPDEIIRRATYSFVERLQGLADIALYVIGSGTAKIADYTSNPLLLRQPLSGIPRRTQGG